MYLFLSPVYSLNRFFHFHLANIEHKTQQILLVKIIFIKSKNSFIIKIIEKFLKEWFPG